MTHLVTTHTPSDLRFLTSPLDLFFCLKPTGTTHRSAPALRVACGPARSASRRGPLRSAVTLTALGAVHVTADRRGCVSEVHHHSPSQPPVQFQHGHPNPAKTEQPMTTTTERARDGMHHVREDLAADACECGHLRASHYLPGGSTAGCGTHNCACRAYAREGATGRPAR